jgi:hypothetical protein
MKRSQLLRLWRFGFPAMRLTRGKMKSFPLPAVSILSLCILISARAALIGKVDIRANQMDLTWSRACPRSSTKWRSRKGREIRPFQTTRVLTLGASVNFGCDRLVRS